MGFRQAVRHKVLILAFAGSNPASPAIKKKMIKECHEEKKKL